GSIPAWGRSSPGLQWSGGLSPGPFCVEFACSPRVHKGFPPLRTPTEKTCKITEHMLKMSKDVQFTSPGPRALQAAHCSWGVLEEGRSRMGKSRKTCVCVLCRLH